MPRASYVSGNLLLLSIFGLLLASPVNAATSSTTMPVSATVLSVCVVVATPMVFGLYDSGSSSATDASATVVVTCTPLEDYDIALDEGADPAATVDHRLMQFLTNDLHYDLYTSAARTTIWGDGTAGTAIVSGSGTGLLQTHTVYGRIPTGQFVPPGAYVDLVTVTVTY
jgi:spore coat protein U-like protein